MRQIHAAAAVIHQHGRVLMTLKPNWDRLDIPPTKLRDGETGDQAAARCVEEALGVRPTSGLGLLIDHELPQNSLRTNELGHYQVQAYAFEAPTETLPTHTIGEWRTPQEILDAPADQVSPSARALVAKLMEVALEGGRSFPPAGGSATRSSTACVAIARRDGPNGTEWLAQFNQRWGRYFLVGGHEETGETKTECMLRELNEELHVEPSEVELSTQRALSYLAWSIGSWQWTQYDITAIDASFSTAALARINHQTENRWLTAAEIQSERTGDDKLISPTMRFVLEQLGQLA